MTRGARPGNGPLPRVHLAAGLEALRRGDPDRALEYLTRAEHLGGRHALLYRSLGDLASREGDSREAIRYWRLSLAANPNQPELRALIQAEAKAIPTKS